MKTTKGYLNRPARRSSRGIINHATEAAAELLAHRPELSKVVIELHNKRNPNGFHVTLKQGDAESAVVVSRFIMTQWARDNGYWDACETKSDRRRFAKNFPKLTPSWYSGLSDMTAKQIFDRSRKS